MLDIHPSELDQTVDRSTRLPVELGAEHRPGAIVVAALLSCHHCSGTAMELGVSAAKIGEFGTPCVARTAGN
jgi:hypothetical protein